jgi:hypothetical protein
MSLTLHNIVLEFLPIKRRQNAKGWIIFNAPCCQHRGHNPDTRSRGNLLLNPDGTIVVNCYNCGFKTMYKNNEITSSFESWLNYLGVPRDKIQQVKLELLSKKLNGDTVDNDAKEIAVSLSFPSVELPDGAKTLETWREDGCRDHNFSNCLKYIESRGNAVSNGWTYYWSANNWHAMNNRIIIPFKYENRIVGWTARYAGKPPRNYPRYFNSALPNNYLFNADSMRKYYRKYVILVEGPFDAIAIDGVGVLGSTLNKSQISWINSCDKEIIVLPDRESKNQDLIDVALDQGWHVSFPGWERDIKDAADASSKYGKLFTIRSAILAKTNNKLQIEIKRRMLKG